MGQARSGIERHDVTENDFFWHDSGVGFQLLHNLFHFREHLGSAEFGDDEVVGKERVTKRLGIIRVEEEMKSEFWVFFAAEERG